MSSIEKASIQEFDRALEHVLAPDEGDSRASSTHVRAFKKYIRSCNLKWEAWRCGPPYDETAWFFLLHLPGETAIAMLPPPTLTNVVPEDQKALVDACLRNVDEQSLYYIQALVSHEAEHKRRILNAAGFNCLTQLIYLQRPTAAVSGLDRDALSAEWMSYGPDTHEDFARVMLATYERSDDCPELSGVRPVDAVIASHKASGLYDPELWEIAYVDDAPVGCILLSPHAEGSMIEIVYLGVAHDQRRRGVGSLLINRAVTRARAAGKREITAVVDARNEPARQLYARFAFRPAATRDAFIRMLARAAQ